jgi:hypothetical protein
MSERQMFPEFDKAAHVVTVDHLPVWATSADVVYYNPKRNALVIKSLTCYERRWRTILWRLWNWMHGVGQ